MEEQEGKVIRMDTPQLEVELDLDSTQGEWFPFFGSHVDDNGNIVYEDPIGQAKIQLRSMSPFFEARAKSRKQESEHIINPKTRAMEKVFYTKPLTPEEAEKERDDAWDYAITGLKFFKDKKTGMEIQCTRENKIALMKLPVFNRSVTRCLQILDNAGLNAKEDLLKN